MSDTIYEVGDRVRMACATRPRDYGRVVEVSDFDGDVDEEGRLYGIAPQVTVRFTNGDEDHFATCSPSRYGDSGEPYVCEDLEPVGWLRYLAAAAVVRIGAVLPSRRGAAA
jgi:hypothetical protein